MKRHTLLIFIRNIILLFIGFLISVIIARTLGPELQGKYAIYILIPTLLYNLGNLGIGSSAIYILNNDFENRYSYLVFLKKFIILLAFINTFIGAIFIFMYFHFSNTNASLIEIVLIVCLIPLLLINNIILYIFQALRNYNQYSFNSILPKIIQLLLLILIILFGNNTLFLTLLIFLISNILATLYSIYKLAESVNAMEKKYSNIDIKYVVLYGLKTHLANTVTFINYRLDQLLIGLLINSYSVGVYNVAVIISEKIWSLTNPIITILFPEMSRIQNNDVRVNLTCRLSRLIAFSNIFIGLTFFLFMKYFIDFTFGKEYQEAVLITNVLLIGILLMNIDKILSNYFASIGKPEINMGITNITLISNFILALSFIPFWGIIGAAASTSLAYLITFLLKVRKFKVYNKLNYKEILIINKSDFNYLKNIFKIGG